MSKKNLIILVISFLILFIIASQTISITKLNKLNNVYKDIEILDDRISMYYLDNGFIPVKSEKIDFKENSINPNDNDNYYEIDLDKLENLNIYYGRRKLGKNDIYIINEQSHAIYYYEVLECNYEKIYTRKLNYEKVDLEEYK